MQKHVTVIAIENGKKTKKQGKQLQPNRPAEIADGERSFSRRLFERDRISAEVRKQKEWLCCKYVLEGSSRLEVFDTERTFDQKVLC